MAFTLPDTIISRGRQRQQSTGILQFPSNLGVHGMLMIFKDYSYANQQSGLLESIPQTNIKNAIMLPLPANITDSYNIRVQGFEQGISGAAISDIASNLTGSDSLLGGISQAQQAIMDKLPSGSYAAGALGDILKSIAGNSSNNVQLNGIASAAAFLARRTLDRFGGARNIDVGVGTTINPKSALFFEGVNLKQHSFEWTLAPSNKLESDIIKDIEQTIKVNSLPAYTQVGSISRALLSYPSMVDIYFFGIDSDYFIRFKTCMVQSATFNYTPQGLAVMKGGKPAAVSLSLQLMETDIHTAEDYNGGVSNQAIDLPPEPAGPGGNGGV